MISLVYFDVGGVAILDFSKTDKFVEMKRSIGIKPSQDNEFDEFWDKVEPSLSAGKETDDLMPIIEKEFGIKFPENYSLLVDGFVKRFVPNPSIWPVIEDFKKKSRVGLLTNMYSRMFEEINKQKILPNVNWDIIIDSSVVGLVKPDPAIYKLAEEKSGVKHDEILFVDNSEVNVKSAKEFGWKTFLYDPSKPKVSSEELVELYNGLVL